MKKRVGICDYMKAVKSADRDVENDLNRGFKSKHSVHKSTKDYDRKQNKKILEEDDRSEL